MILPDFPETIRRSKGHIQGRLHLESPTPITLASLSIELRQVIPAAKKDGPGYEKVRLGSQSWYDPIRLEPDRSISIEVNFSFSSRSQMEEHRLFSSSKAQRRMSKTLETLDLMRSEFTLMVRAVPQEGPPVEMSRPIKMIY